MEPNDHSDTDVTLDQMIERWAAETVALAASNGLTTPSEVASLFASDPLLEEAFLALQVRRGEVSSLAEPPEHQREMMKEFVSRSTEVPKGAKSWLAMQIDRKDRKE